MCRNQPSLRILANAFHGIGVDPEVCLSAPDTMEWLVKGHYSALVLDFDLPGAAQVARMVRILSSDRRPVIFTMIGALTPVGGAFQAGANFVLYKPLEAEQVSRSLRAARGFLNSDRRRSRPVATPRSPEKAWPTPAQGRPAMKRRNRAPPRRMEP